MENTTRMIEIPSKGMACSIPGLGLDGSLNPFINMGCVLVLSYASWPRSQTSIQSKDELLRAKRPPGMGQNEVTAPYSSDVSRVDVNST